MSMKDALRLPVVAGGAEYLVMGYLMRRNILTYRAPPGNEGYDLICIHPEPRHVPRRGQKSQVRVQVKSRFATDAGRGFPLSFDIEEVAHPDGRVVVFHIPSRPRGSACHLEGRLTSRKYARHLPFWA